jgi:hypothetical protein
MILSNGYDETQGCVNAFIGTSATYVLDKAKIVDNKCSDTKGYICEVELLP